MIGLDTNVLVRYLTQDDAVQAAAASRYIETALTKERPGYISVVVLCELVWVLEGRYGHTREQIAPVLYKLLTAEEFRVESRALIVHAANRYGTAAVDFADCLMGLLNQDAGCEMTVTFDKQAARLPTHSLLR